MTMKEPLFISIFLGLLALTASCGRDQSRADSKSGGPAGPYNLAPTRKEIIGQNVLGAQLAGRHDVEGRTTFAPTEPIPASLYLNDSVHIEPRRISAFLLRDETVIEEQSIASGANERRLEFDFSFAKTPRPSGTYQIKFIEIARSNGGPVLLARLFLNVE
jgi:hypothetical protein